MKLTSLFHLSLMTLAAGLTADLAAAATVQPKDQSSASAQAEAKEARARHNASESEPQEPLTLTFKLSDGSINQLTFNKEESFSILAHLLDTNNIEELRKRAAQPSPIPVSPTVYDAITIVAITERERPENVNETILKLNLSFEGAMAWYTAYMQAVANKEIKLGQYANLNGAVGACVVKLIKKIAKLGRTDSLRASHATAKKILSLGEIIEFLLQDTRLTSIKITTEYGTCDAAQYMFRSICINMIYRMPDEVFHAHLSLSNKQNLFKILPKNFARKLLDDFPPAQAHKIIDEYRKSCAEKSNKEKQAQNEQAKSATAAKQQPKVAPAPVAAESDHPQANPAPIMDAPAQPKNILTRAKDFFRTHRLARYGAYALVGAAAIYGGYRWYQRVNMRKLPRYVGL